MRARAMGRGSRRGWAGVLIVLAALTACTPEVPATVTPPTQETPPPEITIDQESAILGAVAEAITAADEAGSVDPLRARASDPALQIRDAQYKVSAATGDLTKRDPLTLDPAVSLIVSSDSWPRFFIVVTQTPSDAKAPFLAVLTQQSPRDQYVLWGWTRMMRAEATPGVASAESGVAALAADASGLRATPAETVAQYADVRQNRTNSQYYANFAEDKLRTDLDPADDALIQSMQTYASVTNTFVAQDTVFAVETADGGAWVVGLIQNDLTATVTTEGASLAMVSPDVQGLTPTDRFSQSTTLTALEIMSFYVPPEASTDPITVVAGEHYLVSVTGS